MGQHQIASASSCRAAYRPSVTEQRQQKSGSDQQKQKSKNKLPRAIAMAETLIRSLRTETDPAIFNTVG